MEIHFKTALSKDDEQELTINPTEFAERKIRPLKKYVQYTQETTQVYVEFGKATAAHQHGSIWRVLINLDSHGKRYHAEATSETMQSAIEDAVKEVEVELRKAKQRSSSMMRRGGNALKSLMRGFTP